MANSSASSAAADNQTPPGTATQTVAAATDDPRFGAAIAGSGVGLSDESSPIVATRGDAPWIVATQGLSKHYGEFKALSDCSFHVRRGEVFGVLGPNGAGKSTLIRLLMGFLEPTHGTAAIDGLDCYQESVTTHQRVAYLPGDARLFPSMRGRDVLRFFAASRGAESVQRAEELATRLELDVHCAVNAMSTGMRQKLAIAAVLSATTPLIILDEPTANLDPTVRAEIIQMIAELRSQGQTVIFSSHVLSEIEDVCQRVQIMRAGKIVHTQEMAELRQQHQIHARATGELTAVPSQLSGQLLQDNGPNKVGSENTGDHANQLNWVCSGDLMPAMQWLTSQPIADLRVEPMGLKSVYERFHQPGDGLRSKEPRQDR